MSNITITNVDNGCVLLLGGDLEFRDELLALAGADTILEGTILARRQIATAIAAAADGGNTGNGTVTAAAVVAGLIPLVGAYNLEMVALGTKNGTAVGAAVKTGTGNGTASAVAPGAVAQAGDYVATCIDASVSGSEIFNVIAPDGSMLENLTVGVAYLNEHFGITISDGSTDFIVGDYWTISITDTGGLFKLVDPNGMLIADNLIMDAGALQVTVIEVGGMTFTITAGATDFIVGDKFGLTVAADGDMVPYAQDGVGGAQIPMSVLTYEVVVTGAVDEPIRAMKAGRVRKERLVIDGSAAGVGITDEICDQLQNVSIVAQDSQQLAALDNQ